MPQRPPLLKLLKLNESEVARVCSRSVLICCGRAPFHPPLLAKRVDVLWKGPLTPSPLGRDKTVKRDGAGRSARCRNLVRATVTLNECGWKASGSGGGSRYGRLCLRSTGRIVPVVIIVIALATAGRGGGDGRVGSTSGERLDHVGKSCHDFHLAPMRDLWVFLRVVIGMRVASARRRMATLLLRGMASSSALPVRRLKSLLGGLLGQLAVRIV
jgi:hypothetical protein